MGNVGVKLVRKPQREQNTEMETDRRQMRGRKISGSVEIGRAGTSSCHHAHS